MKFDLQKLKEENPALHDVVLKGKAIRNLFPGLDSFTKNFPINGTEEKELFRDAVTGFVATEIFDSLFTNRKKIRKKK